MHFSSVFTREILVRYLYQKHFRERGLKEKCNHGLHKRRVHRWFTGGSQGVHRGVHEKGGFTKMRVHKNGGSRELHLPLMLGIEFNGRGIKYAFQFSVHERDTSSLPVPEKKFKGTEGERLGLGQLVVNPEVVS